MFKATKIPAFTPPKLFVLNPLRVVIFAQSPEAVEYTDCTSAEG